MKRFSVILFSVVISACANPYSKFYQGEENVSANPLYVPVGGQIKIHSSDDFDRDVEFLLRKGYAVIGSSSFNAASNSVTEAQLMDQAKK